VTIVSRAFAAEVLFGITIRNSDGRDVPVRMIAEQHILEDLGRIPSLADWVRCIKPEPWFGPLGTRLGDEETEPAATEGPHA
jgi:hypothetical protein